MKAARSFRWQAFNAFLSLLGILFLLFNNPGNFKKQIKITDKNHNIFF